MSGAFVSSPHGWHPGEPVESAEGCVYATWDREAMTTTRTIYETFPASYCRIDGKVRLRTDGAVWEAVAYFPDLESAERGLEDANTFTAGREYRIIKVTEEKVW